MYIAVAAILASVTGGGYGVWWVMDLKADHDTAVRDLAHQKSLYASCTARTNNILEDKESDNAVDAIPDNLLFDYPVPDHWLLPAPD